MCPGGTVVAATSEPGRVVTNGMSQYSRNERNANAGIVVGIAFIMHRNGYPEETYFSFGYTPVRDEAGNVLASNDDACGGLGSRIVRAMAANLQSALVYGTGRQGTRASLSFQG